ncbi:MAG: phosphotransferase family protein [Thermosulfidibacteraceae bacterium]|jgi:hypothetical protein
MHEERKKYIDFAKKLLHSRGIEFNDIIPASLGQKGLVYIVDVGSHKLVLRLYRNLVKFVRSSFVRKIAERFEVSVKVRDKGLCFRLNPLVFAFMIEDYLESIVEFDKEKIKDFIKRLSHFHSSTLLKVPLIFSYFWNKWLKDVLQNVDYLSKEMQKDKEIFTKVLEVVSKYKPLPILSICHKDIYLDNFGIYNEKIFLFDWDASWIFSPFFDFSQVIFSFRLDISDNVIDTYVVEFLKSVDNAIADRVREDVFIFMIIFLMQKIKKVYWKKERDNIEYSVRLLRNVLEIL